MNAIEVQNISKRYVLGGPRSNSLRELMAGLASRSRARRDELWALDDVSFDVAHGETLGIIGHNGAGKSTLLKILSRVTKPTRGAAKIHGRVGSLLEVGTGFHNELTGRENIFMNGAILGMRRAEIERKFDEIVAFSEVERFLDTQVKHYSSGMYMRLAFSVAAHLEPEILIVDEVLAVGDMAFQRKCLDKMEDIGRHGRTVLFVSHNMQAVSRFCTRTIWMEGGRVREDGDTDSVVSKYLSVEGTATSERTWGADDPAPASDSARMTAVRVLDGTGEPSVNFDVRVPILLEIEYETTRAGKVISPAFHVYNEQGICLFGTNDIDPEWRRVPRPAGKYRSRVTVPGNLLPEGTFRVSAGIFGPLGNESHFLLDDVVSFSVYDPMEGDSARGDFAGNMIGVVRPLLEWRTEVMS